MKTQHVQQHIRSETQHILDIDSWTMNPFNTCECYGFQNAFLMLCALIYGFQGAV